MTGLALAELVGISRQVISQYESGATSPSPEVLERIAEKLTLPVAFFLRPITEQADRHAGLMLFFRSLSAATATVRTRERRRFEWHAEITDYLRGFVEFPPVDFPDLDLNADPAQITNEIVEAAATATRTHWAVPPGPIADVVELMEAHGAIIVRCPLGADSLDAFTVWNGGTPHVVLSDDKRSAVRSRWDAAHELGHLVLHRQVIPNVLNHSAQHKEIERQAHLFAGAFLLPSDDFSTDFVLPTVDALVSLKPKWRVSVAAMIMRAFALGLIDSDHQRRMFIAYNSRGWRKREPFDDEMPVEQPKLLRAGFEIARQARFRTIGELRMALPFAPGDIEQLASLPTGYFDDPRLSPVRALGVRPEGTGLAGLVPFPRPRDDNRN